MARLLLLCALVAGCTATIPAAACPFCTAVRPSLSQRQDEAAVALLAEVTSASTQQLVLAVQKPLAGGDLLDDPARVTLSRQGVVGAAGVKQGQLALALAARDAASQRLTWEVVPLDEVGYAYVARAPARRLPAAERLAYYAKYLEHPAAWIAEDAYLEFGSASFDDVAAARGSLPQAAMRRWLEDSQVPETRKGFYGLALGLATSDVDRDTNRRLLEGLIAAPADDFRAGFDGMLGGYLLLSGSAGLGRIERQLLANPQARTGDVRHAATALRFMREFGHGKIADADLNRAMRRLLARPELAAAAIIDLARWQDREALPQVVALFDRADDDDDATRRAVVGYLLTVKTPAADAALAQLRERHPQRVAEAERQLRLTPTAE